MANSFHLALADTTERETFFEKTGEFLTKGLVGSAISAGTAFYNTAVELGNAMGADFERVDTEETITDLVGESYGDYYRDNQELVDTVGLVAGSFLPGTLAVKAARAFAAGTLSTKTTYLATAIREAMIPAQRVAAATNAVKMQNFAGAFGKQKAQLIAKGFVGNFLEAGIYEAATLMTMNQSTALSREDVGYFEAIGQNLDTAAFGMVFGGVAGGLIGGFTDVGRLKAFIQDGQRSKEMVEASRGFKSGVSALLGDESALQLLDYKEKYARLQAIKNGEVTGDLVQSEAENLRNTLLAMRTELEGTMNKHSRGNVYGTFFMERIQELLPQGLDEANLLETTSGAVKFGGLKVRKAKASDLRPSAMSEEVINGKIPEISDSLKAKFKDFSISEEAGIAQINREFKRWSEEGVDFQDDILEAMGFLKAEDTAALWGTKSVRVNKRAVDGKVVKDKATGKPLSTPLKLRETLEDFLDEFAPEYKLSFENYVEASKLAKVNPELAGEAEERLFEMAHPKRMFAAVYRILNQAELTPALKTAITKDKRYSALYQWMDNNAALRHRYGGVEAILDLRTMKAVNRDVAASAVDLGPLKVTARGVSAGSRTWDVKPGSYKFDEVSGVDAGAQFAWATSRASAKVIMSPRGKLAEKVAKDLRADDLPTMTAILRHYDFAVGGKFVVKNLEGKPVEIAGQTTLRKLIHDTKRTLILREAAKGQDKSRPLAELEHVFDVDEKFINAVQTNAGDAELAGSLFKTADYNYKFDLNQGTETFRPNYMTIEYSRDVFDADGVRGWGQADIWRRVKAQQDAYDTVANSVFREYVDRLPDARTLRNGATTVVDDITSQESTVSFLGAASSDYLSAASFSQAIGQAADQIARKQMEEVATQLSPFVVAVNSNKEALAELSILEQATLRSGKYKFMQPLDSLLEDTTAEVYRLLGINTDELITEFMSHHGVSKWDNIIAESDIVEKLQGAMSTTLNNIPVDITAARELATKAALTGDMSQIQALKSEILDVVNTDMDSWSGAVFGKGHKAFHEIQTQETVDFLKKQVEVNRKYLADPMSNIMQVEGAARALDPDVIYPGRFRTDRFNHIAYVNHSKESLSPWTAKGQGMIVAHSEEALQQKIRHMRQVYGDDVNIITKEQQTDFLKAQQRYDMDMDVTDNFVDQYMAKEGKLWNTMPEPSPDAANQIVASMQGQIRNVVRKATAMKYAQEIATLKQLDKAYMPKSSVGKADYVSPYQKIINQMLFLPNSTEHTWWSSIQEVADKALSKQIFAMKGAWTQAKTSGDWKSYQAMLDKYGLPSVYKSEDDWILANASVPRPVLNEAVAKANGIFSNLMLRLDPAQWTVNAMAMPIMLVPEIGNLIKTFGKMDATKAKRLGIALSAAVDDAGTRMPTNGKVMQQAVKNLWNKTDNYLKEYADQGITLSMMQELRQVADEVAFNPKNAKGWMTAVEKAVDKLGRPGDWSEQFVKFVSADSARQVLEAAGISKTHPMFWPTIRTFVSNVTGNYYQAQRPGLFQGWAGQAIGLFQTYQFNLIQRFFRHVQDGNKMAKYMAGIQASTFGMQSLPGFQLLNAHVGERANGEKDFYSVAHDSLDNPVAEFLLYGAGSSLTKPLLGGQGIDFFTRGDLTPRTPILIPTSFAEVPLVNAVSRTYGVMARAIEQAGAGVDGSTVFWNALASQGLNRPLAGAAQLMQGYRTTAQGNMLVRYPELGAATTIAKLMGTRVMDESIAVNSYYRALGYRATRMADLDSLASSFKAKMRSEGGVTGVDLQEVMASSVEKGGRIETFSRWMKNVYTNANESTVNQLRDKLSAPEGRYLQSVMGAALPDGYASQLGSAMQVGLEDEM